MKPNPSNPLFAGFFRRNTLATVVVVSLAAFATQPSACAADLFWDGTDTTGDADGGAGTWNSVNTNWDDAATGGNSVIWTDNENAVFGGSAGTVTLSGTFQTPSITVNAGYTFTGGAADSLNIGGATIDSSFLGDTGATDVNMNVVLTGSGGLTIKGHGNLSATGGGSGAEFLLGNGNGNGNTFSGGLTVTGGLVSWTSDASFGDLANAITLKNFGGLLATSNRTLDRNVSIDATGATLRTYGAATLTINGLLSGGGDINRTDGGVILLTNSGNTYSGTWNLQGGALRVGGAGIFGTQTINNGTSVEFFNDGTAGTYTTSISGAGITRFESAAGTTFAGTISGGTGTLWVGDITNNAAVTFANGANINVNNLSLGESGSVAGIATQQTGSSVTVNNDFRVGHWSNETSVYNMAGGSLSILGTPAVGNTNFETPGVIILGVDGTGVFNQTGGTVTAAGLGLDTRGETGGTDQYNLNGGTLILGSKGIGGFSSSEFNLGGGTLQASNSFTSSKAWNVNSNSTLEFDGFQVTQGASISGSASLNLIDSYEDLTGKLILNGASQTVSAGIAGSVPIDYSGTGTLTLSGTSTHTGDLRILGGTLNMTGSTASAASLGAGTTIRGEGSISGGLTFNNFGGANTLIFNPGTQPTALAISGGVVTDGTVTLQMSQAPPATTNPITVATYDSISGSGTFIWPNSSSYRSSTISVGVNALTLDLDTKVQIWTNGTTWDTGTTGVWNDGNVSNDTFYWGDHVVFNDTATTTAVTLSGDLQPGLITVSSNTNNFSLTGVAGTAQVETATAAGTATGDGNVDITVTCADLPGSPLTLSAPVLTGDAAATWAGSVRSVLSGNADITNLFTVGGTGAAIVLTRKASATGVFPANDDTLNIALLNGTPNPGITDAATSANTTAGVLTSRISGPGSLVKSGSSTLTISGVHTFSGGTTISQGTIVYTGSNNNGLGTGTITLGDANTGAANVALLLTNGREINNSITVSADGAGTATLGFSGTGSAYTAFNGGITLGRNLSILAGTTDRLHFGGNITGTGGITINGGQRVTMSGNNSFSGNLSLSGTGTLFQTFGGNPVPDSSSVDVGAGAIFQVYTNETIAGLNGSGALRPIAGKPTLTVGGNNSSGSFGGLWTNNGSDHVNITKIGTGTQTLSGTITSPGAVTISAGTVAVNTSASFDRTYAPGTALPNRALQGAGTLRADAGANVALRRSGDGFTGSLAVTGGTVTIGHPLAAGNAGGSVALQGGTLAFDNTGSYFTPFSGSVLTGGTLTTDITTRNYGTMHNTGGDVVPGATTHVYHGKIYLTAGLWSFAKRFDDAASITIGGVSVLNNSTWDATATGSYFANATGWYDIDVRVQQGSGGVGPSGGWTKGIGIKKDAATTNNADYVAFDDAAMSALGARVAFATDITFARPISVSSASVIDTSAMVGTPGSTAGDGNGANGDITLTSGLSGAGNLSKTGAGTLLLNANNSSFTGNLIVNGGALRINNSVSGMAGITVNAGGVLESNATNIFVGGHGVPMLDSRVISVNGGTWIMTGSHDARFGNVSLSNGATWTSNRGVSNYDALLANTTAGPATVLVSNTGGNTSPSIMNGSGGLHLQGVQNFNVANVTGNANADLLVSMIIAAQGTTGGDPGGIRKIGAGTMTLTAANSYNGGTIVEGGTLMVNNTSGSGTGSGSVVVKTGATLGGTGAISGAVTVENGGTLVPGTSIESLATGTLTLSASSSVDVEIDSSGTPAADVINVTGTANLAGALNVADIAATPAALTLGAKLTLITYTTGVAGEFAGRPDGSTFTLGPNLWKINYADSNAVTLEVVAPAGGYDSWKTQITNGEDGRAQDADDDGFTNLQEFLFGTDPMASTGSLTTTERSGGNLIIRWRERTPGASYTLLESATLANPWTPSGAPITTDGPADGDYQPVKATVTIGAGKDFFRVQGSEQP